MIPKVGRSKPISKTSKTAPKPEPKHTQTGGFQGSAARATFKDTKSHTIASTSTDTTTQGVGADVRTSVSTLTSSDGAVDVGVVGEGELPRKSIDVHTQKNIGQASRALTTATTHTRTRIHDDDLNSDTEIEQYHAPATVRLPAVKASIRTRGESFDPDTERGQEHVVAEVELPMTNVSIPNRSEHIVDSQTKKRVGTKLQSTSRADKVLSTQSEKTKKEIANISDARAGAEVVGSALSTSLTDISANTDLPLETVKAGNEELTQVQTQTHAHAQAHTTVLTKACTGARRGTRSIRKTSSSWVTEPVQEDTLSEAGDTTSTDLARSTEVVEAEASSLTADSEAAGTAIDGVGTVADGMGDQMDDKIMDDGIIDDGISQTAAKRKKRAKEGKHAKKNLKRGAETITSYYQKVDVRKGTPHAVDGSQGDDMKRGDDESIGVEKGTDKVDGEVPVTAGEGLDGHAAAEDKGDTVTALVETQPGVPGGGQKRARGKRKQSVDVRGTVAKVGDEGGKSAIIHPDVEGGESVAEVAEDADADVKQNRDDTNGPKASGKGRKRGRRKSQQTHEHVGECSEVDSDVCVERDLASSDTTHDVGVHDSGGGAEDAETTGEEEKKSARGRRMQIQTATGESVGTDVHVDTNAGSSTTAQGAENSDPRETVKGKRSGGAKKARKTGLTGKKTTRGRGKQTHKESGATLYVDMNAAAETDADGAPSVVIVEPENHDAVVVVSGTSKRSVRGKSKQLQHEGVVGDTGADTDAVQIVASPIAAKQHVKADPGETVSVAGRKGERGVREKSKLILNECVDVEMDVDVPADIDSTSSRRTRGRSKPVQKDTGEDVDPNGDVVRDTNSDVAMDTEIIDTEDTVLKVDGIGRKSARGSRKQILQPAENHLDVNAETGMDVEKGTQAAQAGEDGAARETVPEVSRKGVRGRRKQPRKNSRKGLDAEGNADENGSVPPATVDTENLNLGEATVSQGERDATTKADTAVVVKTESTNGDGVSGQVEAQHSPRSSRSRSHERFVSKAKPGKGTAAPESEDRTAAPESEDRTAAPENETGMALEGETDILTANEGTDVPVVADKTNTTVVACEAAIIAAKPDQNVSDASKSDVGTVGDKTAKVVEEAAEVVEIQDTIASQRGRRTVRAPKNTIQVHDSENDESSNVQQKKPNTPKKKSTKKQKVASDTKASPMSPTLANAPVMGPLQCPFPQCSFISHKPNDYTHLTSHEEVHAKEYALLLRCPYAKCGLEFWQARALNVHLRITSHQTSQKRVRKSALKEKGRKNSVISIGLSDTEDQSDASADSGPIRSKRKRIATKRKAGSKNRNSISSPVKARTPKRGVQESAVKVAKTGSTASAKKKRGRPATQLKKKAPTKAANPPPVYMSGDDDSFSVSSLSDADSDFNVEIAVANDRLEKFGTLVSTRSAKRSLSGDDDSDHEIEDESEEEEITKSKRKYVRKDVTTAKATKKQPIITAQGKELMQCLVLGCKMKFPAKSISSHMTIAHSMKDAPFKCPFTDVCAKGFKQISGLLYHLKNNVVVEDGFQVHLEASIKFINRRQRIPERKYKDLLPVNSNFPAQPPVRFGFAMRDMKEQPQLHHRLAGAPTTAARVRYAPPGNKLSNLDKIQLYRQDPLDVDWRWDTGGHTRFQQFLPTTQRTRLITANGTKRVASYLGHSYPKDTVLVLKIVKSYHKDKLKKHYHSNAVYMPKNVNPQEIHEETTHTVRLYPTEGVGVDLSPVVHRREVLIEYLKNLKKSVLMFSPPPPQTDYCMYFPSGVCALAWAPNINRKKGIERQYLALSVRDDYVTTTGGVGRVATLQIWDCGMLENHTSDMNAKTYILPRLAMVVALKQTAAIKMLTWAPCHARQEPARFKNSTESSKNSPAQTTHGLDTANEQSTAGINATINGASTSTNGIGSHSNAERKGADTERRGLSRLGVLAVTDHEGMVRLYAVPNVADVRKQSEDRSDRDTGIVHLDPVALLSKPSSHSQCTAIDWGISHKIAIGTLDGMVIVYDLSHFLKDEALVPPQKTLHIPHSQHFMAEKRAVNQVCWHPHFEQNVVMTSAITGEWHIWDTRDAATCLLSRNSYEYASVVLWPHSLGSFYVATSYGSVREHGVVEHKLKPNWVQKIRPGVMPMAMSYSLPLNAMATAFDDGALSVSNIGLIYKKKGVKDRNVWLHATVLEPNPIPKILPSLVALKKERALALKSNIKGKNKKQAKNPPSDASDSEPDIEAADETPEAEADTEAPSAPANPNHHVWMINDQISELGGLPTKANPAPIPDCLEEFLGPKSVSITHVQFCPSFMSGTWAAYAYESGFVRIRWCGDI
ncbi:hypothetical protein SARC_05342 [Sphaeroforma arctica JP610]|uniref:C2H2-type domain-containing protein n=1 Tax=Sphaeroforma arctica JP610 TaxID=667725 RepID=A0A0L0G0K4_9EUKA|nr:hypothetical protein SARC_05342 [Sphaeroforma arctica JP610]KNC82371.1 hypothetical protein SARC_05342 [Sphaeroforma arctica JP610]|eukprot:XP_014156273.1 hypothetical protein SARC_05342 [Sphaeroforma arctica JP610]